MQIILGTITLIALTLVVAYHLDKATCAEKWSGNLPYRYLTLSGCQVRVQGTWIPEANYRLTEVD